VPSPLLHGAAGAGLAGVGWRRREKLFVIVALIVAANVADLDLLPGLVIGDASRYHHGFTHSLGAAVIAGVMAAAAATWFRLQGAVRFGVLVAAAFASHVVLDMLSIGKSAYNAVPLFWPITNRIYTLPPSIFPDIQYDSTAVRFFGSLFSRNNLYALLFESATVAVTAVAWKVVGSGRRETPRTGTDSRGVNVRDSA
jgi:membrane-bound metal-dependent hydrolase YbcI (DUF457 family)